MCNVREGPTRFENTVQTVFLKKLIFFAKNYFFYVLDCFDVLISKIILKKNYHFDAFRNETLFEKQSQPHSQTVNSARVCMRRECGSIEWSECVLRVRQKKN